MPTTYKILGQVAPLATTDTLLYVVPGSTQTIVSSIIVCNRGTTEATFRVRVAPNGAVAANSQYVYYDVPIAMNDTFIATVGITMDPSDTINVYAGGTGSSNLTFQVYGSELT